MSVNIKVDVTNAVSGLHELEKQHLPFALAATLTSLAKGARTKVKGTLPSKFHLRNNFTEQGIRFKPADKREVPMQADVHTDTENRKTGAPDYLEKQEDGSERVPYGGRNYIAIPTKYLRRMIGDGVIRAEIRPKSLLSTIDAQGYYYGAKEVRLRKHSAPIRGFVFFTQTSKSGTPMIMGRYWTERDALPFYILVREVTTLPRLDMEKTVREFCDTYLEKTWDEQWKTMRAKGLRFT